MLTKTYTVEDTGSLTTDTQTVAAIVASERQEIVAEIWYGGFRTRWFQHGLTGCSRFYVNRISPTTVKVRLVS